MVGVDYTGNETHDDYNEYYYVEKAPFGAENVRSYRYRGLIRDPNRKKSKRRDYAGVRRKALKEMLGFGAETSDYSQTGNVAAEVTVGYEWTIYDMDDDDIDNDELLSLIDSAVQDHIVYEYENERDPSSQGVTYVNYVNEDEKVEELSVYYRYDVNVELGAEDIPKEEQITQSGLIENPVGMAGKYWINRLTGAPDEKGQFHGRRGRRYDKKPTMQDAISSSRKKVKKSEDTRPKKDIEICPDFRKNMDHCYLKKCKVCAKEGRTPEALRRIKSTGWYRQDGKQKGIRDEDFGIVKRHDRGTDRSKAPAKYGGGTSWQDYGFDSEGYEPEPLNMQGAVGVLIALAGIVLYKL